MDRRIALTVAEGTPRKRLDVFLAESDASCSRSRAKQLILDGHVTVNGKPAKPSHMVGACESIAVVLPEPRQAAAAPEPIPVCIVFEDPDLLVVNKPAGLVVHPAPGHYSGTLVNALLAHCGDLSGINGTLRPGIVHRLDKNTSGLMVVAKSDLAHRSLTEQLQAHTLVRQYKGIVWGRLAQEEGRIEAPIGRQRSERKRMIVTQRGSRPAATRFVVEETFDFLSLLRLDLETGRTHQIRVHLAHIGHPVFGDPEYGGREKRVRGIAGTLQGRAHGLLKLIGRQALHAQTIGFVHPRTGEPLRFTSDLPEDMEAVLRSA